MIDIPKFRIVYKNDKNGTYKFDYVELGEPLDFNSYEILNAPYRLYSIDRCADVYCQSEDGLRNILLYENDIAFVPEGYDGDYLQKEHYSTIGYVKEDWGLPYFFVDIPSDENITYCKYAGNKYEHEYILEFNNIHKSIHNEFCAGKKYVQPKIPTLEEYRELQKEILSQV